MKGKVFVSKFGIVVRLIFTGIFILVASLFFTQGNPVVGFIVLIVFVGIGLFTIERITIGEKGLAISKNLLSTQKIDLKDVKSVSYEQNVFFGNALVIITKHGDVTLARQGLDQSFCYGFTRKELCAISMAIKAASPKIKVTLPDAKSDLF